MIAARSLARAALVVMQEYLEIEESAIALGMGISSSEWGYFVLAKELAEAAGANTSEPEWGDRLREIAYGESA